MTPKRRTEILATLADHFPAAFPSDPKAIRPLKIGAYQDIKAALPAVSARALRQVLARHTRRLAYLRALIRGGERVDLAGNPVEPVTPEQQAFAAEKLKEAQAWLAVRPAAPPQAESKGKGKGKPREVEKRPQAKPRTPLRPILRLKRAPA